MKNIYFLIFLGFPIALFSQQITGTIYDAETTIKGAKIYNETQNKVDFSDGNGNFKIEAAIGDQLVIISLFHNKFSTTVAPYFFKEPVVFELKKITNELDEVQLKHTPEKPFDSIQVNTEMNVQLANDIQNRPYLYEAPSSGNMDFVKIAELIGSLFKKKDRAPGITYATAEDLERLFKTHSFFTNKLRSEELHIPEEQAYLFFDYCSARQIDSRLISEGKSIELLELLLTYSKAFKEALTENKKD